MNVFQMKHKGPLSQGCVMTNTNFTEFCNNMIYIKIPFPNLV